MRDSPVERERKLLPQGDGNWPGYGHVYDQLQKAAHKIAETSLHCSDEHIQVMAVLGCGHEETMKYEMARCYSRGFI